MASEAPAVAIIGSACRFAGASSPARLWQLLRRPRHVASCIPDDRFSIDTFYHADPSNPGTTNAREAYFLDDNVRAFDASFFNISPNEANAIDPQQRLLLETVYESLDTAGQRLDQLHGSDTAVYCGSMSNDYASIINSDMDAMPQYSAPGTASSMTANRVSYFFDWHGPSVCIDTACSSSLVAMHSAVESLRNGECSLAITAASSLILSPHMFVAESKLHMLSPTSRCHMWDDRADGYARGEGVASIVLKRLPDALRDGDPIECVVRGIGINSDGRGKGLTIPNNTAQQQLIRSTYLRAGLDPTRAEDRCQFFEAHGTGTPAGDPEEAAAIYNVFFQDASQDHCKESSNVMHVGSIKTVIGHTEAAAGLAGVIKASLCLQHGIIPPNLHFNRLNPNIEQFSTRLIVPTEELPWPPLSPGIPRRVSINSFGLGGTNAHVILESFDYNHSPQTGLALNPRTKLPVILPFIFTAASPSSLVAVLGQYKQYLEWNPDVDLVDLAASLITRRSQLKHQAIFTAVSVDDLVNKLQDQLNQPNILSIDIINSIQQKNPKRTLGIFTGQGAQWPQMCLDLISASTVAFSWLQGMQKSLDELPPQYRPDFSMAEELSAPDSSSRLNEAIISLPIRTAVQIIQINILRALGISFDVVVGHSSGEIAAAYAAGILTSSDAIRIAYLRGFVVHQHKSAGGMMAVNLSWHQATEICTNEFSGKIEIAACNSPSNITLSGELDALYELKWLLESLGQSPHMLHVDTAYHSQHMLPCAEPYCHALNECNIQVSRTSTKWFSSVLNGDCIGWDAIAQSFRSEYWKDNMIRPVMFSQALSAALTACPEIDAIFEIGPHPALKGPSLQILSNLEMKSDLPYIALAQRSRSAIESLSMAIGLSVAHLGADAINLAKYISIFDQSRELKFIRDLPSYPFDHMQSYWAESRLVGELLHRTLPPNPLLGNMTPKACQNEWRWRNFLSVQRLPWLGGHCFDSRIVFPAAGYISMVVEAATVAGTDRSLCSIEIENLIINHAIIIPANSTDDVETLFHLTESGCTDNLFSGAFNCLANFGGKMKSCASGRVTITFGNLESDLLPLRAEVEQDLRTVDVEDFYRSLDRLGLNYSGPFQAIMSLSRKMDISSGIIQNADGSNDGPSLRLHPANLDAGMHSLNAAVSAPGDGQQSPLAVPVEIERITINPLFWELKNANHLLFDSYITKSSTAMTTGDVHMFDQDGHGLLSIENLKLCPIFDPIPTDDDLIFSSIAWGPLVPNSLLLENPAPRSNIGWQDVERVALLYICDAHKQLVTDGQKALTSQGSCILAWMDSVLEVVRERQNKTIKCEWLNDTLPYLLDSISSSYPQAELQAVQDIGQNLIAFLRGDSIATARIQNANFLGKLYNDSEYIQSLFERLSGLVAHIVFRFPSMNILEIGARNTSATRSILDRIKRAYDSYTCTDNVDDHFESFRSCMDTQNDRLLFKTFDVELDPLTQGFENHYYDLIIDLGCTLQTLQTRNSLSNIRKILKPGGFLVSSIIDDSNSLCTPLIFGACASNAWWSTRTLKGDTASPFQMREIWEKLLLQTGFTGIETIAPMQEDGWAVSVTVSRAADDRLLLSNNPLLSTQVFDHSLVLVGGSSDHTTHMVSSLLDLLTPKFKSIVHSKSIEALDIQDCHHTVFMLLEDMDKAVFHETSEQRLLHLQQILNAASTLLWVSPAHDTKDPFMGMSKGFLRSVTFEYPLSKVQHLQIERVHSGTATQVAQIFMRLVYADSQNDYRLSERVDNYELELLLTDNGGIMIPRLQWSDALNQRHLSGRYAVKPLQVGIQSAVQVIGPERMNDGSLQYHLDQPMKHEDPHDQANECSAIIEAEYSTLQTAPIYGNNFFHVISGKDTVTGEQFVALSAEHASVVTVPLSRCHTLLDDMPNNSKPAIVKNVAAALLALHIITMASPGTAMLVHESQNVGEELQAALSYFSQDNGTRIFLGTSKPLSVRGDPNTILFHEKSSVRQVCRLLPRNLSLVVDMSEHNVLSSHIKAALPQNAIYMDLLDFCRSSSSFRGDSEEQLMKTFERAVNFSKYRVASWKPIDPVPAHRLPDILFKNKAKLDIVDWTQTRHVPVPVRTASSLIKLSAHKTYLLVGMTGNLGRSLAEWMVDHGAQTIILASRSPKVNSWWIAKMSNMGARILYMAMDVSNRDSVLDVHHAICEQQLLPVGGVVNGAMILNDSLFGNMSIRTMESTFKPKVRGSLFLDELYRDPKELDFFILVGSLTGPIGNPGQAAYGAAATFMASLVRQRREQFNLPGSVIHPGAIIGLGYLEKVNRGFVKSLTDRMGPTHLSERDFHELFAEGILAGRPGSSRDPEVIAGFRQINSKDYPDALCYSVPKLWSFINHSAQSSVTEDGLVASNTSSIKIQLEQATSNEQVLEIVSTGLMAKLRIKLGLFPDQGNLSQKTQLAELGVDSLIALDLRSWFSKEVGVDVSILEILSGVSIGDLAHSASLRHSENV